MILRLTYIVLLAIGWMDIIYVGFAASPDDARPRTLDPSGWLVSALILAAVSVGAGRHFWRAHFADLSWTRARRLLWFSLISVISNMILAWLADKFGDIGLIGVLLRMSSIAMLSAFIAAPLSMLMAWRAGFRERQNESLRPDI
jgi:hypothetical protein